MSVDGVILTDMRRLSQLPSRQPFVMVVTGPSGSGKTAAIHSVLLGASASGLPVQRLSADSIAGAMVPEDVNTIEKGCGRFSPSQTLHVLDVYSAISTAAAIRTRNEKDETQDRLAPTGILVIDDLPNVVSMCSKYEAECDLKLIVSWFLSRGSGPAVLCSCNTIAALPEWVAASGPTACAVTMEYAMPPLSRVRQGRARRVLSRAPSFASCADPDGLQSGPVLSLRHLQVEMCLKGWSRSGVATAVNAQYAKEAQKPENTAAKSNPVPAKKLYGLDDLQNRLEMLVRIFLATSTTDRLFDEEGDVTAGCAVLRRAPSTTGILLHGASGCGKTALIHRVALLFPRTPFIFVQSTQLYSKYLGESEERLREYFSLARARKPSVIVLDDVDAIAAARQSASSESGSSGGLDVSRRMLAALLCELDGVTDSSGVLVIGLTNQPSAIDGALLRQGRLETSMFVPTLTLQTASVMTRDFLSTFDSAEDDPEGALRDALVAKVASAAQGCTAVSLTLVFRVIVERLLDATSQENEGAPEAKLPLPTLAAVESALRSCAKHLVPPPYLNTLLPKSS